MLQQCNQEHLNCLNKRHSQDQTGLENPKRRKFERGGKRRLPCHARSVPPDHTEETAYFEIPPNVVHGMPLACSHPTCVRRAAKRVRFRYCAVCYSVASSQNFHDRHSHSESIRTNADNAASQWSTTSMTHSPCLPDSFHWQVSTHYFILKRR